VTPGTKPVVFFRAPSPVGRCPKISGPAGMAAQVFIREAIATQTAEN